MSAPPNVLDLTAGDVMTPQPDHDRAARLLAVEALKIMETHKITSVIVVDDGGTSKASCTSTISGARR